MIAPFPHRYDVVLRCRAGDCVLLAAPGSLVGGPPPEFGGTGRAWSPEQLLLGAASLCLETTFAALAVREKLEVSGYEGRALGVLDKTREGLRFTSITLEVALETAPADRERAAALLRKAKKHCIVANSLNVPVELVLRPPLDAPAPGPTLSSSTEPKNEIAAPGLS